jgi:hypothetical protein
MSYSQIASRIVEQKVKYWMNTLSQDAIEDNMFTVFDVKDNLDLKYDLTTFDSLFSTITVALAYSIPFTEMPAFSNVFNVYLPTDEMFVKGVNLEIERTTVFDKYPDVAKFIEDLKQYVQTHFPPAVAETTLEKAYYGVGRYGYVYFDPRPIRDFLKSTIFKEAKRSVSPRTLAIIYKAFIKALNLDPGIVNQIYIVLRAFDNAKFKAAISNYSWSDVTEVLEESNQKIKVPTDDIDGRSLEFEARGLGDLWLKVFSVLTGIDLDTLLEKGLPEVEEVPDVSKRAEDAVTDRVAREQKSRLNSLSLLVSNYQTADERTKMHGNMRVEIWGSSRKIYYGLKEVVEREIDNMLPDLPRFVKNQYNVAVQQLYSRLTRDGGWGYEAYRSMSIDQLKTEWVEEWKMKGLNGDILDKLFDKMLIWIERFASQRAGMKIGLMSRYLR